MDRTGFLYRLGVIVTASTNPSTAYSMLKNIAVDNKDELEMQTDPEKIKALKGLLHLCESLQILSGEGQGGIQTDDFNRIHDRNLYGSGKEWNSHLGGANIDGGDADLFIINDMEELEITNDEQVERRIKETINLIFDHADLKFSSKNQQLYITNSDLSFSLPTEVNLNNPHDLQYLELDDLVPLNPKVYLQLAQFFGTCDQSDIEDLCIEPFNWSTKVREVEKSSNNQSETIYFPYAHPVPPHESGVEPDKYDELLQLISYHAWGLVKKAIDELKFHRGKKVIIVSEQVWEKKICREEEVSDFPLWRIICSIITSSYAKERSSLVLNKLSGKDQDIGLMLEQLVKYVCGEELLYQYLCDQGVDVELHPAISQEQAKQVQRGINDAYKIYQENVVLLSTKIDSYQTRDEKNSRALREIVELTKVCNEATQKADQLIMDYRESLIQKKVNSLQAQEKDPNKVVYILGFGLGHKNNIIQDWKVKDQGQLEVISQPMHERNLDEFVKKYGTTSLDVVDEINDFLGGINLAGGNLDEDVLDKLDNLLRDEGFEAGFDANKSKFPYTPEGLTEQEIQDLVNGLKNDDEYSRWERTENGERCEYEAGYGTQMDFLRRGGTHEHRAAIQGPICDMSEKVHQALGGLPLSHYSKMKGIKTVVYPQSTREEGVSVYSFRHYFPIIKEHHTYKFSIRGKVTFDENGVMKVEGIALNIGLHRRLDSEIESKKGKIKGELREYFTRRSSKGEKFNKRLRQGFKEGKRSVRIGRKLFLSDILDKEANWKDDALQIIKVIEGYDN